MCAKRNTSFSTIDFGKGYPFNPSFSGPNKNSASRSLPRFFRITSLRYDEEAPRLEAFENVLGAFTDPAFHLVYVLSGSNDGVTADFGAAPNYEIPRPERLPTDAIDIVEHALHGNFPGSLTERLPLLSPNQPSHPHLSDHRRAAVITGIPTMYGDQEQAQFQGMDRLINSMRGENWSLVVIARPIPGDEVWKHLQKLFDLQTSLSCEVSHQVQTQSSDTEVSGTSSEDANSSSDSKGVTHTTTTSKPGSDVSNAVSKSESTSSSKSARNSNQTTNSYATTKTSTSETREQQVADLSEFIEKQQIPRLKKGITTGMFLTTVVALADDNASLRRLTDCLQSYFQSNSSSYSHLRATFLTQDRGEIMNTLLQSFQFLRSPLNGDPIFPLILGHPGIQDEVYFGTILTAQELCLLAGLPQREVAGIEVAPGVDFGLNIPVPEKGGISLGHLLHRGHPLLRRPFCLAAETLCKHVFVAGATGYGKTTTCHRLLKESGLPFLVIEPAKTEYRELLSYWPDLLVFTLGNERLAPFRFNPFELLPGEELGPHIDLLKTAFTAAFPMEAAMPQLLEEAIYETYIAAGWDIHRGINLYCDDPCNDADGAFWPTLSDLLSAISQVVRKKKFDQRLAQDYEGSLRARLVGFTVGAKGRMLNTRQSFDFNAFLDRRVVFEMEDLPDPQDKSFLMGLLLIRLRTALRLRHAKDRNYRHLTLIEEAHRLMERPEPGSGGSRRHAIVTFTDLLAEIRQYGEGLIIVDQIPGKLAPEVMKNTSTKIIHRLLAQDDKEAIGASMALRPEQANFLSHLRVGEAIAFSEAWPAPAFVKIAHEAPTGSQSPVTEEKIRTLGNHQFSKWCSRLTNNLNNIFGRDENAKHRLREHLDSLLDSIPRVTASQKLTREEPGWRKSFLHLGAAAGVIPASPDDPGRRNICRFLATEILNRIPRANFISLVEGNAIEETLINLAELWDVVWEANPERFAAWIAIDSNRQTWSEHLQKSGRT
ncbi:MAG: ATP-binding protein [Candidatus Riflebacteria bacterium]|nr:ATP-binding protein [Candidatus Riflebacteria bacterium]